jgi:hemerythrin-like domain-containing protein
MPGIERMDVFKSVHKGLRRALFNLAQQAGIADSDRPDEMAALTAQAREVFHFLEHHARNEDRFLIPLMEAKFLASASKLQAEHADLDLELADLLRGLDHLDKGSPSGLYAFYLALNRFIGRYLRHLNEEETQLLPLLHGAFTDDELAVFSRKSVSNTTPSDQAMMLGHMFPAMQDSELRAFFEDVRAKAPEEAVQYLEGLAHRILGRRAEVI